MNDEAGLLAAVQSNATVIILTGPITLNEPLAPIAGVTIDGGGNKLTFENTGAGNNTAEGLYIADAGITIKNLVIDTPKHGDNGIEIYNSATLENVTVIGSKKTGIYVNNDGTGTITVNFKNVNTSSNKWNAGIGLVAQKVGSKIIANLTGTNVFGETVGVYSDNTVGHSTYLGSVSVNGLTQTATSTDTTSKDNWK